MVELLFYSESNGYECPVKGWNRCGYYTLSRRFPTSKDSQLKDLVHHIVTEHGIKDIEKILLDAFLRIVKQEVTQT